MPTENPIHDRILTLTLDFTMPITLICVYAPTAAKPLEKKHKFIANTIYMGNWKEHKMDGNGSYSNL